MDNLLPNCFSIKNKQFLIQFISRKIIEHKPFFMNCIDLYSGIGGWILGMKLAGLHHLSSFEWNPESNLTHNINFGTKNRETNIREINLADLPAPGSVDIVVGSPPCIQFSYANRGGKGNIEDGLVDIHKFLSIIQYLKPKHWAMENVPRVKDTIIL